MSVSRAEHRRCWHERLARFATSNLTVAQFCAQEGVSTASFYQWRRRGQAAASTASNQSASQTLVPRFLPVALNSSTASPLSGGPSLELELPNRVRLRMTGDIDSAFVGQLLTTIATLGPSALAAPSPSEAH